MKKNILKDRIINIEKAEELKEIYDFIGIPSDKIGEIIEKIRNDIPILDENIALLSELRKMKQIRKLADIPGFGKKKILEIYQTGKLGKLNEYQKIGYKYHKNIVRKIPLYIGKKIFETIAEQISGGQLYLAGSIRRERRYAGDMDLLYSGDLNDFERDLKEFVVSLVKGDRKITFLARFKNNYIPTNKEDYIYYPKDELLRTFLIQIDVRRFDKDTLPSMLLYFTGSRDFNIMCRVKAIEKGLLLNEYGLYKDDERMAKSEIEILEILGLGKYINPRDRSI